MNPSKTTPPIDRNPAPLRVGLIIIGDEILSGKRADKHLPKFIEILAARGLQLAWTEYLGDDPARITESLQRAFASGDVVFSCGGIGATPDDHTRQCAGKALRGCLTENRHTLFSKQGSKIIKRLPDLLGDKNSSGAG